MFWQDPSKRSVELLSKQGRIKEVLAGFRKEIQEPLQSLPWEVRVILFYVREHLFDPNLNVSGIRRDCHLRNNNISTRFRCALGIGLREYIETGRLAAAKRLLIQPDLEIYLIAMSVGYDYQETFCRAFQRQVGCTPSEWRLGAMEESQKAKETPPPSPEGGWRIQP